MPDLFGARFKFNLAAILGAALVMALLLGWALRLDTLRSGYKADRDLIQLKFDTLVDQTGEVVVALRLASDNEDVTWSTAKGQIVAMGESNRALKTGIARQNAAIDDLAREAVRLKAEAAELRAIAAKARAQRQAALDRLSGMATTPGTRSDCMKLLAEAEEALDLVREAGL